MTTTDAALKTAGLVVVIIVTNIMGASLLPRTAAFTNLPWTAACLAIYVFAFYVMAYTIRAGLPLSSLVPLMSAVIPLATIAIGVLVYRDAASALRIGMLSAACVLVGGAMMV